MSIFAIPFHDINPVALKLGFIEVRWYGLAYLSGLLLGWWYIRKLVSTKRLWSGASPMKPEKVDDLLIWVTLGVVAGGRLGYVLLYNPAILTQDQWQIFAVWQGGMSFHGGLLGTILAIIIFSRVNKISIFSTGDLVAAAVPFGLFFGRIANFINGGLYGRVTDVPWAMVFDKTGGGTKGRHPSQLYEAFLEGIVILVLLWFIIYARKALMRPGFVAGVFLVSYAIARSAVENFREPEPGHMLNWGPLTAGIVYSIPMALFGLYLIFATRNPRKAEA